MATTVSPEEMQKRIEHYADEIRRARRSSVAVGLPKEKIGGQVYGDGMTVVRVGAIHEYGAGKNPRRSFLRVPFAEKRDEINTQLARQFRDVAERGKSADRALGLIGTVAVNYVKEAFTTRGFGQWPDIMPSTKEAKGSSQVLIDTGTLRNSITYAVRDND